MVAYKLFCLWIILDFVGLELISRKKNGMNDLYDLYVQWDEMKYLIFKVLTIVWLIMVLPITIPASIIKIIKQNKDE
jgi:hypothetical protein